MSTMEDSPRKQQSTSRVIDSLHSQIDDLRHELEVARLSCGDYKKKSSILASRNESLVDQLANCKHENDMVNALLKRKERRIVDLEAEFDDLNQETQSVKQAVKNYKIRCDNLQESSASSTAEFERLKISYDALVASQTEYKRHYQDELNKLTSQLDTYKLDSTRAMTNLMDKLERNDKDVDALLDGLDLKRTATDNVLVERNRSILGLLSILAKAAKAHGEDCKSLLLDNVQIINTLREKNPEIFDRVAECSETTVDLDELLHESAASLETNLSDFETKVGQDSLHQGSMASSLLGRRKHRVSLRVSADHTVNDPHASDVLPRQRGVSKNQQPRAAESNAAGVNRQHLKRNSSHGPSPGLRNSSTGRLSLSGLQSNHNRMTYNSHSWAGSSTGHKHTGNQKTNPNNNQRKNSKRKLFHGGSNNFNIGASDRSPAVRVEETNQG